MSEESLIESEESNSERDPMEEDEESVSSASYCCDVVGGINDDDDDMYGAPLRQVEAFLDHLSNRSFAQPRAGYLLLSKVVITRSLLALLLPLLEGTHDGSSPSLDDDNDNVDTSTGGTSTKNIPVKFVHVRIEESCRFFSPMDVWMEKHLDYICTTQDKFRFFSALAHLPHTLMIEDNCPEFVSGLLIIPEINHLEAKELVICQQTQLSDLEYLRLGALIQASTKMTALTLQLPYVDTPREFYDSLAKCIHLQRLSLRIYFRARLFSDQRETALSNLMFGEDDNSSNGVVERLLRNPQNQLRELDLELEDHHLIAIAQLLPTCRVEDFDFSNGHVQADGLVEFSRLLPKMHSLRTIALFGNPWEKSALEDIEKCSAAVLHGLMEHPFLTYVDNLDRFPQCSLLWHYCSLNCAGRDILIPSSSEKEPPILDGLWPHILARAGRLVDDRGPCLIPLRNEEGKYTHNGPANAVYFFLQTAPHSFPTRRKQTSER